MNKQLLEKLEQFQKAYHELDNAWTNVIENDDMNNINAMKDEYPFEKSFNDIDKWVKSVKEYQLFKEGNFLVITEYRDKWIYIFKSTHDFLENAHYYFCTYDVDNDHLDYQSDHFLVECTNVRLATDKEKKLLLTKLHEVGKDWNPETMKIVKYKWMPKIDEKYYIPDLSDDNLYLSYKWAGDYADRKYFNKGLVFKTKEKAIEVAKKLLKVLE